MDSATTTADVVLRPPVSQSEVDAVEPEVRKAILEAERLLSEKGVEAFRLKYGAGGGNSSAVDGTADNLGDMDKAALSEEAVVTGSPRQYQLSLLEHARCANSIIHLGTGQGKTLIALMRIKELSHEFEVYGDNELHTKKQTWFLVPSVALAVQQTETISANLPSLKVETACDTASNSAKARDNLAGADVMVATHGAALDLLRHYGDMFHLERVNLLVIDECHYATGKHGYAQLMESFYHNSAEERRPRVLGLTASPLINVKKRVTEEQLSKQMTELERMLDARVVSYASLDDEAEDSGLMAVRQDLEETVIPFRSGAPAFLPLPEYEGLGLHKSRYKELNQLASLYEDLGPKATGEYTSVLGNELTQSRFEGESNEEFDRLVCYLNDLSKFCLDQCSVENNGGLSNKLEVLESLLEERFLEDSTREDHVGLIFVQMRITAIALHHYLQLRQKEKGASYIRCNALVRQASQVFKYVNIAHKLCDADQKELNRRKDADWLHRVAQIKEVLDGLRKKDINLLIATSVVEEGVDVSACSFVAVFDNMKTTKSFVQMKGRARQKRAKFFCFHDKNPDAPPAPVSLDEAKQVERKVERFLKYREKKAISTVHAPFGTRDAPIAPTEEEALRLGEYCTAHARVDLLSAKSLLNRYCMAIPMESTARSTKESMAINMPTYDVNSCTLVLPAHLPADVRYIKLPQHYHKGRKKKTETQLALVACVRLRKLGLLNDRLLPLERKDMHEKLMKVALAPLPEAPQASVSQLLHPPSPRDEKKRMFLHPLTQAGNIFNQHDEALGGHRRCLGVLSLQRLPEIPYFSLRHVELGHVDCSVGQEIRVDISGQQWLLCAQFYTTIMNARWRRRTSRTHFEYNAAKRESVIDPYLIVSLTENGIDWHRMRTVIEEYSRSDEEKTHAVRSSVKTERMPRLWAPLYDPNITYICHSASNMTCSAPFPNNEYTDYADYMQKKRSFRVDPDSTLYAVQHLWTLPRKVQMNEGTYQCTESELKRRKVLEESVDDDDGELSPCRGLRSAFMPQTACMEAPLADASLYLHLVLLPQIIYHMDRFLVARAFVAYSQQISSLLGKHLNSIDHDGILEALTANSCAMGFSYDRLEYLGDAVLKVLHTDALLHSPDLKEWTSCLHEGDLSKLRSEMGSNKRLKDAATSCGIDRFILTRPLSRGEWAPTCFTLKTDESNGLEGGGNGPIDDEKYKPSKKVIADVVEALLGLVYLHSGFGAAAEVAESLGVTLPYTSVPITATAVQQSSSGDQRKAVAFLGCCPNPTLVQEATTHASFLHSAVASYQKLEWVGDAVLTLAAREWAYKRYKKLKVASLVVVESTIVCNETLSYIACRQELQGIIRHADTTLPARLESFVCGFERKDWGLWQGDPPKILADVVEALLGAAHTDAGFDAGQKAALNVISPILKAVSLHLGPDTNAVSFKGTDTMMHPRQVLSEMTGQRIRLVTLREHEYATRYSLRVWRRGGWSHATSRGDDAVCRISCCGVTILALADHFRTTARNRCSALVSSILARNPYLMEVIESIAMKCRDRTD